MGIRIEEHNGVGLKWGVESNDWKVGIKNFKPENSIGKFNDIEVHLETDEVFILLSGSCALYYIENDEIKIIDMLPNKLYVMVKGTWHNMITKEDTKMILVENKNTSMDNSKVKILEEKEKNEITSLYKNLK